MEKSSTNLSSANALLPYCQAIETVLLGSDYFVMMHIQMVLLSAVLILIALFVLQYGKHRIAIHGNLRMLFVNILILYFVHSLTWLIYFMRYRILLYTYSDVCDLLTPVWMVPVLIGPYHVYSVAYPSLHFAVTIERIRALFLVHKYESMGPQLIIKIICAIWFFALAYLVCIVVLAFADPEISSHPQGLIYIASAYNASPMFCAMLFTMLLVVVTALCDWRVYFLNKRLMTSAEPPIEYNLSEKYQINENALAMLLIFPLDLLYALIYPIYNIIMLVLRAYRPVLTTANYVSNFHTANTLIIVHSLITLTAYIRFIKYVSSFRRRKIVTTSQNEETKIHFKQLQEQWN